MHCSLFQISREDLHVATAAVDLLLVLHSELNDQRLALVAERLKTGRGGIETSVLAGLEAWDTKDTNKTLDISLQKCKKHQVEMFW